MLKRSLSLVALLVMIPMMAFAGTVNTRVMTTGGSISVNGGAAQTSVNGTVSKSYTTAVPVVMTPAAGYAVSQLTYNGVNQPLANSINIPLSSSTQTLAVSFAKQAVTVTASATTNDGSVNPYGSYKTYANTALVYTFTPNPGKSVVSINGLPAGAVLKDTAGNVVALPFLGTVKAYFSVTANTTLSASFVSLSASAGAPQTVILGSPATLKGSASDTNGTTYAWTQTSGPATATLSDAAAAAPTFTAPAAGVYGFKLTATNGTTVATSTTNVTVAATAADAAKDQCVNCHNNSNVGAGVFEAWNKSTHSAPSHSNPVMCYSCHVGANEGSHPGKVSMLDGKTDTCSTCHKNYGPGANYGLYSSNGQGRTPHFGGANEATATGIAKTQYLTSGAVCTDCHGHNNSINAGFAEGGHGAVSNDPLNAFVHYDWGTKTNDGTRQNGNCTRCHTAGGFLNLLGAAEATRLKPTAGQPNNVLICVACHKSVDKDAPLRTDATPAGSAAGALSNGYFALFSSSASAVGASNTKIQVQFPGFKNSSICIPCHSGRSTDQVFVAVIAQAKAVSKNYSTISTSYYQHAANMGQTFIGKGAYDFTGARVPAANTHNNVQNGSSDTQGPCVGCHYQKAGASHSLEVVSFDVCKNCHLASFGSADLAAAEEKFNAGVKVLDDLIRTKFNPLRTNQNSPLESERVNVRFGRFNKAAGVAADDTTAKKAYGAWYNWQLLTAWDKAAFVHNPGYAKQVLFDTIDYLDDAAINGSAETTIQASTAVTDTEKTAAVEYFQAPCAVCHATNAAKVQEGKHAYEVATHSGSCGRCHTTEGYTAFLATNQDPTGSYTTTSFNGATNVSCGACHDSHGSVRQVANFAPKFADTADAASEQFKLCTSCHNLMNGAGQPVASGLVVAGIQTAAQQQHYKDWYRNIASTHYDLPSTGTVTNVGTTIEGYNVRFNKPSSCTDCHGHEFYTNTNGAAAAVPTGSTIHTEWAQSGHAGKILNAKFAAFTTAGNSARSRTQANNAAVMAAGVTSATGIAWEHYNWDDSTGTASDRKACQRCHTATGASNYLDAPATYNPANNDFSHLSGWASTKASPQNEVLYCWGCHKNAGTGELRTPGAIPAEYKKDGASFSFPDVGASNVCIACHAGRDSGSSIVALTTAGNTFSNVGFVNSHYMAAAGLMYAKVGYTNFVPASTVIGTSTYGASMTTTEDGGALTSTHRKLGTAAINGDSHNPSIFVPGFLDSNGPCATCHYAKGNHELEIGKVQFEAVCINCHTSEGGTPLTADNFKEIFVEEQSVPFQNALGLALAKLEANYNIRYDINAYPYFYDKNLEAAGKSGAAAAVKDWTRAGALSAADAEKLMGACFNINVLKRDPAAYAHARTYTRRLIYDTIDFLDDGTINLSTGATALAFDPVKYVAGSDAKTSSESYKYLRGYAYATGAWSAVERP